MKPFLKLQIFAAFFLNIFFNQLIISKLGYAFIFLKVYKAQVLRVVVAYS